MTLTISPHAYVTFRSNSPGMRVNALLGEETAKVTSGYGGWIESSRARRRAVARWESTPVLKMTIPILFDGFLKNRNVEPDVKTLEKMAAPVADVKPPPIVFVSGPVPHTDVGWIIQSIDWGDSVRNGKGVLLRQPLTVELWQYLPEDIIKQASPAAAARARGDATPPDSAGPRKFTTTKFGVETTPQPVGQSATIYSTQAGDTLTSIAANQLGDYTRWKDIAALNNLRDPFLIFPVGTKVRVPKK